MYIYNSDNDKNKNKNMISNTETYGAVAIQDNCDKIC